MSNCFGDSANPRLWVIPKNDKNLRQPHLPLTYTAPEVASTDPSSSRDQRLSQMCWTQKLFFSKKKKTLEKRCVSPRFFSSAPRICTLKQLNHKKKKWILFTLFFSWLNFSTAEWFFSGARSCRLNVHQQTLFFCFCGYVSAKVAFGGGFFFWNEEVTENSKMEGFFQVKRKTLSKRHVGLFFRKNSPVFFFRLAKWSTIFPWKNKIFK